MAHWKHIPKAKNDMSQDPTGNAFFSNEVVGNLSNALIREGIQNNLDEAIDGGTVKTRMFLSGNKYALQPNQYLPFIDDLTPHLNADNNGIIKSALPDFKLPLRFLVFEDFNTKGLEGDPNEYQFDNTRDKSIPHNFYFFWRASAISGKLAGKMGSWGVGKSVFPASSKINAFWAVTVRDSDKQAYLIGQSVLKTHNRLDKPEKCGYSPYGYYANFDSDDFALPEQDEQEISKFAQAFKLHRRVVGNEKDTGLSIIVPFYKDEISLQTLVYSTVQQFFYPIILGKLVVEITEEDKTVVLNSSNLEKAIRSIDYSKIPGVSSNAMHSLLSISSFGKWASEISDKDFIELKTKNAATAYEWRQTLFADANLSKLQKDFDDGKPLAFKIPVKFQPKGTNPELRYFNAFIQKDVELTEPENYFIREYLHITGIKSLKRKGVRGMVIISDKDLVTFLGQAEGPAHTGWHKDNFRADYESADKCLSFVQRSLEKLYGALQLPITGIDKDLLKDTFYVDDVDNEVAESKAKKSTGAKKDQPPPEIGPSRPKHYLLSKIDGGFKITANPALDEPMDNLSIKVAYLRADGKNAFSRYSIYDFDVRKLHTVSSNVEVKEMTANEIKLEIIDTPFEFEIAGFDKRRDLIVDLK